MKAPRSDNPSRAGFTLIELIAVLAVMSVVAAMIVPALMQELDRAAKAVEARRLSELSSAFRTAVMRTGTVPAAGGWTAMVAPQLGCRTQDIVTNNRALPRAFVVDPNARVGPSTFRSLPFVQTSSGSEAPTNLRFLFLSSMGEPLPTAIAAGNALSATDFEAIWQSPPDQVPAGWTWSGRGEDLLIERVQLSDLFLTLSLNNPESAAPRYGVSSNALVSLGSGNWTASFLRGTSLFLADETGRIQTAEVLSAPGAWVFANGKWQRTGSWNLPPSVPAGRDFEELANSFTLAPLNPAGPVDAARQVLSAMTNFAAAYVAWGAAGFATPLASNAAPIMAWQRLHQATDGLLASP